MRIFILVSLLVFLFFSSVYPQEIPNTGRRKYYSVEELITLIERAREAGLDNERLQKLEIRDGDQQINVMDYIEKEKLEQLREDAQLKELLNKNFLTVNDIYKELVKTEPDVILKLREELVSER